VRWEDLFAGLELEAAGLADRERDLEIADRTRAELATVPLQARFRAALGVQVSVRVAGAGMLHGDVRRVTPLWVLLAVGRTEWVVSWPAVMGVTGLPAQAVDPTPSAVESRLGWPATWRALARDRAAVHIVRRDGSSVTGVPGRAGEDFVEVGLSGSELPLSGRSARTPTELVPYDAVAAVRLASAESS